MKKFVFSSQKVSIGGAAALFFGFSFVSLIEPIYFAVRKIHRVQSKVLSQHRNFVSRFQFTAIRFDYFVNNSGVHGLRYLDRRYASIDR